MDKILSQEEIDALFSAMPSEEPGRGRRRKRIPAPPSTASLNFELPISISFGSSEMPLEDILKLGVGSVIELDKSVSDPVTIMVHHTPIAKGEMVVNGSKYLVRILEVQSEEDRIRSLR